MDFVTIVEQFSFWHVLGLLIIFAVCALAIFGAGQEFQRQRDKERRMEEACERSRRERLR